MAVGAARHHQIGEILRRLVNGVDARGEVAGLGAHDARRQLDVLGAQRILHIVGGDVARRHGAAIQIDAHGVVAFAAHHHPRHAVHHRQAVDDNAARVIRHLQLIPAVAHQIEPHDGAGVGVRLGHARQIHLVGQAVEAAPDGLLDVVDRGFHVAAHLELDGDGRRAVAAHRVDELDAVDTTQLLFENAGDLGIDDIRRRARIGGDDTDHGRVDVGILAQRHQIEGHDAEHHQQQVGDDGDGGPLDGDVGENHGAAGSSPAITT